MFIYKYFNIKDIDKPLDNININPTRKEYLDKLKGDKKISSFLAWICLKQMVLDNLNLDIEKLELTYNDYGKPLFREFYFSISHSDDLIAIAISNLSVGIDIQLIDNKDYHLIAKKMNLTNLDNENIIKNFSKIEAYSKKIGTGILPSYFNENINIKHQEIIKSNDKMYVLSYDY